MINDKEKMDDADLFISDEDDLSIDFDFDELDDFNFDLFSVEDDPDEEYLDVTERILKLSDRLSEDIILHNIEEQLDSKMVPYAKRVNYVTLFKKKVNKLNTNSVIYNKGYIEEIAERVKDLVLEKMEDKFSVSIGNTSDFYFYPEFLDDLENLYEFVFVRQFENLVKYFLFMIRKMKTQIVTRFSAEMADEENANDIFVSTMRKKFKNESDVIILHFISEIVDFIIESSDSAYDLYTDIANLDPFETVSIHILKMLENYGNGIVFKNDITAYQKYFEPLQDQEVRNEFLNEIKMKYLEDCTLNEDLLKTDTEGVEGTDGDEEE